MNTADEVAADLFASRISSLIQTDTATAELVRAALAVAYTRGDVAGRDAILAEWRKHLQKREAAL